MRKNLFFNKIVFGFCLILLVFGFIWSFQESYAVTSATKGLNELGKITGQTGFEKSETHAKCTKRIGAESICSVFMFVSDYLVYVTASLAVLYMIIAFIKLIMAGDQVEEELTKQKNTIKWIILGLLLIVLADNIILDIFFGRESGGIIQPGQGYNDPYASENVGKQLKKEIVGIYNVIKYYVVYIAILVVIISGARMIIQSGKEEAVTSARTHILAAAAGLVIIGLSEGIVYVFYPPKDEAINVAAGFEILSDITLFITSFISVIAVSALVYAGYLYIMYFGQDDMIEKSKKIMKSAVIALIIVSLAYAIVYTLIYVEHTTDESKIETIEFVEE